MENQFLSAEILVGAICLSVLFAFTFIFILAKEVARESHRSERDQFELFLYLRATNSMFNEYHEQHRDDEGESPPAFADVGPFQSTTKTKS